VSKTKKMYVASDVEIYGLLKSLVEDEGYDIHAAADRLRGEIDEAEIEYENKDDE